MKFDCANLFVDKRRRQLSSGRHLLATVCTQIHSHLWRALDCVTRHTRCFRFHLESPQST